MFLSAHGPKLVLAPTMMISLVFVYGFIGFTVWMSVSNWSGYNPDLSVSEPWYDVYTSMLAEERFQSSLRNMVVFTVLFLVLTTGMGLFLAMVIHSIALGSRFFRNLFLFPYALSFIVSGTLWRWLFEPESGINTILQATGILPLLSAAVGHELKPGWLSDPTVLWPLNDIIESVIPGSDVIKTQLGIPIALVAVVIAASWQFVGFAMAFFLAALGGVPVEVREAAKIDGAGWWATQRFIVIPLIRPAIAAVVTVLLIASLKIFDLIVVMGGSGPGFATDMPGLYVYDYMFRALRQNAGAAAAVVMLISVSIFAIPYLWRSVVARRNPEDA